MSVETSIYTFEPAAASKAATLPKLLARLATRPFGVRLAYQGDQPLCHAHDTALARWAEVSSRWHAIEADDPAAAVARLIDTNVISPVEASALAQFAPELALTFDDTGHRKARFAQQLDDVIVALGLRAGSWKRPSDHSLLALGPRDLRAAIVIFRLVMLDLADGIATDRVTTFERPAIAAVARLAIDPSSMLLQDSH